MARLAHCAGSGKKRPARPGESALVEKVKEIVAEEDPSATLPATRIRVSDTGRWVGPCSHLAQERERLGSLGFSGFDWKPLGVTLGAEIHGVALGEDLSPVLVAEIRAALCAFKVLVFRAQNLSSAQHTGFAKLFGDLEIHPFIPPNPDEPELVRFEKGSDISGYENVWHHDVTWRECPSMGAVLRAVEVPAVGGDTLFCDMNAAYEGLDAGLRSRVDGLRAVHDYIKAFGHNVPADKVEEMRALYPEVEHPVVRTHPETGKRCLFVNSIFTREIIGLSPDDSHNLLEELCAEADYPEYQVRVRWEPGTVVFWDNRAVQHYASSDYWPQVRIMERASICGDRPV